jgi:hypothetical protein
MYDTTAKRRGFTPSKVVVGIVALAIGAAGGASLAAHETSSTPREIVLASSSMPSEAVPSTVTDVQLASFDSHDLALGHKDKGKHKKKDKKNRGNTNVGGNGGNGGTATANGGGNANANGGPGGSATSNGGSDNTNRGGNGGNGGTATANGGGNANVNGGAGGSATSN